MKDFAGNELSIGDEVAYIGTHYRHMVSGIVVAFTKHKIRVGHKTYDQRTIDLCAQYNHPLPTDLREPGYVALIKRKTPVDLIGDYSLEPSIRFFRED